MWSGASSFSQQERFGGVWRVKILSPIKSDLWALCIPPITLLRCENLARVKHLIGPARRQPLQIRPLVWFLATFAQHLLEAEDAFNTTTEIFWFSTFLLNCISIAFIFSFSLCIAFKVVKRIQLVPIIIIL